MTRIALTLVCLTLLSSVVSAGGPKLTVQLELNGARLEGAPISVDDDRVYLLGRDGRLWDFPPAEAKNFKKLPGEFHGFTAGEQRAALQRELGGKLEVTGVGHYLVAHPPGEGGKWAQRFEDLYRSFLHFFSSRGLAVEEPRFPLVAIVWSKQEDFLRYAASQGANIGPGVLGYYSPVTNRVTLYDLQAGKGQDWQQNADTIIHEATHQTAFNTGVHSRFALPPRWLAEGLGTLYEARGVWNSRFYPAREDRINRGRLKQFRELVAAGRPTAFFLELVASDRMFASNPGAAYAEAWAFTFYLTENEPRKYNRFLALTAKRPEFENYSSAQRVKDFKTVFGDNLKSLDINFLRFIEGQK